MTHLNHIPSLPDQNMEVCLSVEHRFSIDSFSKKIILRLNLPKVAWNVMFLLISTYLRWFWDKGQLFHIYTLNFDYEMILFKTETHFNEFTCLLDPSRHRLDRKGRFCESSWFITLNFCLLAVAKDQNVVPTFEQSYGKISAIRLVLTACEAYCSLTVTINQDKSVLNLKRFTLLVKSTYGIIWLL